MGVPNSKMNDQDLHAVKSVVLHQLDSAADEIGTSGCRCDKVEMASLGVGPAADGEDDLEIPVLQLEQVQLLEAAVNVIPGFVPRVARVALLLVGVRVCELDSSSGGIRIGERVQDMGEGVNGDILGLIVGSVYAPREDGDDEHGSGESKQGEVPYQLVKYAPLTLPDAKDCPPSKDVRPPTVVTLGLASKG